MATVGETPVVTLTRKRGDTKSIGMTLKDSDGAVIDVTGYTFSLSVNSDEEPLNTANELFTSVGTIVDGPNGKISFPVSVSDADNVGEFFYDAQLIDTATEKLTFLRGSFLMTQDIGKG